MHIKIRWFSIIITIIFIANTVYIPLVSAQELSLSKPGSMVALSSNFVPPHLLGITINPKSAFKFDFIIHKGDAPLVESKKPDLYKSLIKYFLAALTIPDQDQWVNLSPYEHGRVISSNFGLTEMGRDLLAQDYLLKQIIASLMHPDNQFGKKFWERVYAKVYAKYSTTNVPVNTFNKIWIMPDKATIYEKGNSAFIVGSHLKVMTEQDYLSTKNNVLKQEAPTTQISSEVVKSILLPEMDREVNEGKNFANLRQIVSAMILATWYKKTLKQSILSQLYANHSKVQGVDQDPKNNEVIFQKYIEAFKKGAFNLIREDYDQYSRQTIPHKYFSGGFINANLAMMTVTSDPNTLQVIREAMMAGNMDRANVLLSDYGKQRERDVFNGQRIANMFRQLVLDDRFDGEGYRETLDHLPERDRVLMERVKRVVLKKHNK